MTAASPGPLADLLEHAADIIIASRKEPHTAPYHWAAALWKAGLLHATPGADEAAIAIERLIEGLESRNAHIADTGQSRERDTVRAALAHIDNLCRIANRHTGAKPARDAAVDDLLAAARARCGPCAGYERTAGHGRPTVPGVENTAG